MAEKIYSPRDTLPEIGAKLGILGVLGTVAYHFVLPEYLEAVENYDAAHAEYVKAEADPTSLNSTLDALLNTRNVTAGTVNAYHTAAFFTGVLALLMRPRMKIDKRSYWD